MLLIKHGSEVFPTSHTQKRGVQRLPPPMGLQASEALPLITSADPQHLNYFCVHLNYLFVYFIYSGPVVYNIKTFFFAPQLRKLICKFVT